MALQPYSLFFVPYRASNHVFSDWDSIFADSTMTVAAIDRLVHHAVILEIKADSFRQKAAQSRLSQSDSQRTI